VEKIQLNIAFGYLSVLLGYLCLFQPVRLQVESSFGNGLDVLVSSIQEFAIYHREAEDLINVKSSRSTISKGFTDRLQYLLVRLKG